MNATSTCIFTNPLDYQSNAAAASTDIWNYAQQDCSFVFQMPTSTEVVNGFTRGEVVNGFFLLTILIVITYGLMYIWLRGVKINQ